MNLLRKMFPGFFRPLNRKQSKKRNDCVQPCIHVNRFPRFDTKLNMFILFSRQHTSRQSHVCFAVAVCILPRIRHRHLELHHSSRLVPHDSATTTTTIIRQSDTGIQLGSQPMSLPRKPSLKSGGRVSERRILHIIRALLFLLLSFRVRLDK